MTEPIDDLKLAVFTEWCYDPPGGADTFYYVAWGDDYSDLLWPIDEIHDHLELEMSCYECGPAFERKCAAKKPTKRYLNGFEFDTGGSGCRCELTEGGKIAAAALELYRTLSGDPDDSGDPDELPDEVRAVIDAPKDYDSVTDLLSLLEELADENNSSGY